MAWLKEHKAAVKFAKTDVSVVAEHVWQEHHQWTSNPPQYLLKKIIYKDIVAAGVRVCTKATQQYELGNWTSYSILYIFVSSFLGGSFLVMVFYFYLCNTSYIFLINVVFFLLSLHASIVMFIFSIFLLSHCALPHSFVACV